MSEELPTVSEQSIKSLESSSDKNNKLLLIFYLSTLYIFVSVLSTTDLMLLLPVDTFKMPLIGFELNLIYFYVLAPLILILLHFNILFNYHEHLRKLDVYKGEFTLETIDSSMYNYVYVSLKHGLRKGRVVKVILWLLIYLFPLLVFVAIYERFADYHHLWISLLHLIIMMLDIFLIYYYINENSNYLEATQFSKIFQGFIGFIGFMELSYFIMFFYPMVNNYELKDSEIKYSKPLCYIHHFLLGLNRDEDKDCFPRIVVTDEKIAKIAPSTLYIPRQFKENIEKDNDMEKKLILEYGARINLSNRNLRYVNLSNCILTRADMENTELQNANFKNTHLQAVKFSGAKLQDAKLTGSQLQHAIFRDVKLQRIYLIGANMTEAYFNDCNLSSARMNYGELSGANFYKSDLERVDFRNANLSKVDFLEAKNLQSVKWKDANLSEVRNLK